MLTKNTIQQSLSKTPLPQVRESFDLENEKERDSPKHGISEDKQETFAPFISERAVNQPRPLKVIYIGAGISKILAAIKFCEAVPELDLIVYEKNPELGGAWYENYYPGCACDVPSHVYQLSFESWTGWSQLYSGADEIREYWNCPCDS
ncbi:Flavin-containing monooxygenase-like [Aspergillus affinis]|uniref:Flavin-containing monooxygenase-like n=1 Tax=Aspergillus affinis TaxID=1070780 RepID=UPI0022FEBD73|nr:NAD(P)H-dependent oxidoreductase-like protein [Aspergillus affinis]KAI9036703.1 Flavin-containing monooxygenase-like [Aspergillus affinis]